MATTYEVPLSGDELVHLERALNTAYRINHHDKRSKAVYIRDSLRAKIEDLPNVIKQVAVGKPEYVYRAGVGTLYVELTEQFMCSVITILENWGDDSYLRMRPVETALSKLKTALEAISAR